MYFFRHGTSVEFSLATAVTRKVEPTLWYVLVMGILCWVGWWSDHRPLVKVHLPEHAALKQQYYLYLLPYTTCLLFGMEMYCF